MSIIEFFKRDVMLVLSQRLWQSFAGLMSLVIIAHYLSPLQQGWYYSFLSLAALGSLMDLGLSVVLVQLSAHLFIKLKWIGKGGVYGESREYFENFLGSIFRIYLLLSILFAVILTIVGVIVFSPKANSSLGAGWFAPWLTLIICTSLNILILPFIAIVEGSGKIQEVYKLRLIQGVLGAIACWVVMIQGGVLWAASMMSALTFFVGVFWLFRFRPVMFKGALKQKSKGFSWSGEIWPLQWRVGVSWVSGYLLTQIYAPILFYTQGAVVAGQIGLSLAIANMLGLIAQSWIAPQVPAMARAAGNGDWKLLDSLFKRAFLTSCAVFLLGFIFLVIFRHLIKTTVYDERVLSFWPFLELIGVVFVAHVCAAFAAQLRSYKREPLIWVAFGGAIVSVPAAIWAALIYSVDVLILIVLSIQLVFTLPASIYLWRKFNMWWRAANAN